MLLLSNWSATFAKREISSCRTDLLQMLSKLLCMSNLSVTFAEAVFVIKILRIFSKMKTKKWNLISAKWNMKSEICKIKCKIWKVKSDFSRMKHEIWFQQNEMWNMISAKWNVKSICNSFSKWTAVLPCENITCSAFVTPSAKVSNLLLMRKNHLLSICNSFSKWNCSVTHEKQIAQHS